MKIGIDASRYSHESATGVEWYSWHIINGLIQEAKDDQIVLYARGELKLPGVKVIKQKRLWSLIGLSRELAKNPPDVLFVPSHVLPFCLPRRAVTTIHDVAFRYLKKSYGFFQYQYLNWSTKRAVKRACRIIVPSKATADDLVKFFGCPREKLVVIEHGYLPRGQIDEKVFKNSPVFKYFGINQSNKYLLFVGRLETKKNLVRVVCAFADFSKKHPDFRLILAGKRGHGFKEILKKVQELELMHKVIMPGYISEDEKDALLIHCQAFIFTSLYEGFGLPILEAFAQGKPVLTSNVSSMPEVGGKVAVYADPYDTDSIARGMEKVLKIDGEAGKRRATEFSWEKASKKTLKVIHGQ